MYVHFSSSRLVVTNSHALMRTLCTSDSMGGGGGEVNYGVPEGYPPAPLEGRALPVRLLVFCCLV